MFYRSTATNKLYSFTSNMDSIKKKMESLSTEKEAATARANKFEEEAMSWGR